METESSPYRLSISTKPRQKHGATTQSSRGNSAKGTSYSSEQLGQSPGASWAQVGGPFHRQDEGFPQRLQARNAKRRRPGALLEHRQSLQIFCLTHQGRFALVIRENNFILACTLFLLGGEVFNEAESCNIQVKNPPQKPASKKDRADGLRHSTKTKSPQGSALATLACDNSVHKCEDYPCRSRLRVQPD
jgi:hypothetical protein